MIDDILDISVMDAVSMLLLDAIVIIAKLVEAGVMEADVSAIGDILTQLLLDVSMAMWEDWLVLHLVGHVSAWVSEGSSSSVLVHVLIIVGEWVLVLLSNDVLVGHMLVESVFMWNLLMHNMFMNAMFMDGMFMNSMLLDNMLMSVLVEQSQSLQLKVLLVLLLKVANVLILEGELLLEVMLVHALKCELLLMLDIQVVLILVDQLNISCCGSWMVMHRVHWMHWVDIHVMHISVMMHIGMMASSGLLT